ncbi:two-component system sensor histidine kinase DegS [Natranaerovirga pectinivora]|uniref:Oxygen sensor histidine kinase NreB n=1 Tax=Natranaerovirga pectinivora TaxID=682400 RepID=A0A4R3MKC5_9FIRM|nr:sensor histidine kinase [Natranaerovirga pectinivora]TCT12252.1 two-component system sensor histidine kinase DegS [Natranaerovirga pectinivora]
MKDNELHRLDDIIKNISKSIKTSISEVSDMYSSSKREYIDLEKEFRNLKIEATNSIIKVNEIENRLQICLDNIKEKNSYSEFENELDELRVQLALEKERECNLIQRRNVIENHLRTMLYINSKAEKLGKNFELAENFLTGNLNIMSQTLDKIHNNEIFGIKILEAQENERQRIAREMHDGPAQSLTNLVHKTELCIKLIDKDPIRTSLELQSLKSVIRSTIDDIRRIIYNLRPMSIDDLGLIPTIERYIDKIQEETTFTIELKVNNNEYNINSIINLTLFRIIQESLNNIIKYAKATNVTIMITYNKESIELEIVDNGVGFNINDYKNNKEINKGFGLSMMKERVYLLSGHIDIQSTINKGTKYYVMVPTNKEDF